MRVLLLGATGNLGRRCIPALLAQDHQVILYIRNLTKLRSLVSSSLLDRLTAIVFGDATDAVAIREAILGHNVEGIINVAGTRVRPGEEFLLPKIAKAVSDAAVAVGRERGRPMRVWIITGMGALQCPGTKYLVQD